MFVIILLKLPELASGLSGGIAANGFGNLASAVSTAARGLKSVRGGLSGGAKSKEIGGSIKKA